MSASRIPWAAKAGIRVGLTVLLLRYERIRSSLTGFRGAMKNADVVRRAFKSFFGDFKRFATTGESVGALLELGTRGSRMSGLFECRAAFRECILIDVGDFSNGDPALYRQMTDALPLPYRELSTPPLEAGKVVVGALRDIGVAYLTEGLALLKAVATETGSLSCSTAVFQNIRVGEFTSTVEEFYRVHRQGPNSTLQIDHKDHLAASLNNLRFSGLIWESRWVLNSGFYANRLRSGEVKQVVTPAGLGVVADQASAWEALPLGPNRMASEFSRLPDVDPLISDARLLLRTSAAAFEAGSAQA